MPIADTDTGEITDYPLHVGIKKHPVGILALAHKDYQPPASIHLSIHAGRWHVSFNDDDGIQEPTDKDTTDWLIQFDDTELHKMTLGLDAALTCSWRAVMASGSCQCNCRCAKKASYWEVSRHAVPVMRVGPSVSPIRWRH